MYEGEFLLIYLTPKQQKRAAGLFNPAALAVSENLTS
jgi:hypothetical protein